MADYEFVKRRTREGVEALSSFTQSGSPLYRARDYRNALARVMREVAKPESKGILVYGDYDMDGMGGGVLMHRYLRRMAASIHGEEEAFRRVKLAFSNRQNGFGMTREEYKRFSGENDLIIPVDNGSSVDWLHEGIDNLIVLDHHPADRSFPYVINPNAGRKDGEDYSTSGARVAYDFVMNIERNIQNFHPDYPKDEFYMKVLKSLAAITIISDMALLDKENRAFVSEALDFMRKNPSVLPVFSRLGDDFSTRKISFEIVSQCNAVSRLERDIHVVERFLAPRSLEEYEKAEREIEKINKEKKKLVQRYYREYLEKGKDKSAEVSLFHSESAPIGLLGLIANKISSVSGGKPAIVAGMKADGDISISARGHRVKSVLGAIFETGIVEGSYGGHDEACGAKIHRGNGESAEAAFARLEKALSRVLEEHPEVLEGRRKVQTFYERPLTVSEFMEAQELFAELSGGVDFYKRVNVAVSGWGSIEAKRFPSGWVKAHLRHEEVPSLGVSFFLSGEVYDQWMALGDSAVPIFELTPNGEYSLVTVLSSDEVSLYLETLPEMKQGFSVAQEEKPLVSVGRIDGGLYVYRDLEDAVALAKRLPGVTCCLPSDLDGQPMLPEGVSPAALPFRIHPLPLVAAFGEDGHSGFSDYREEAIACLTSLQGLEGKYSENAPLVVPSRELAESFLASSPKLSEVFMREATRIFGDDWETRARTEERLSAVKEEKRSERTTKKQSEPFR